MVDSNSCEVIVEKKVSKLDYFKEYVFFVYDG